MTDTRILARVLDRMDLEYEIHSQTRADIYAQVNISRLTFALAEEHCEVLTVQEKDEGLEGYYVSLMGGDRHE